MTDVATTESQQFLQPEGKGYLTLSVSALYANSIASTGGDVLYQPGLMSKSQEVKIARHEIVKQARAAERASEPIRGGIDRKTDMVVGASLRVHPQPDWESLGVTDPEERKKLVIAMRREFNNWAYDANMVADAEGHYDFGGLMWMAYRNLAGPDAETAIVIGYDESRRALLGTKWASYITVVDPDRVATPSRHSTDPFVYQGRRLDKNGRMIGLYVRRKHPNEAVDTPGDDFAYVPRQTEFGRPTAIHWFMKTRGAQQRGITNLVTVLKPNDMLRKFDESYLAAAVINSKMATYIRSRSSAGVVGERLAPSITSITNGDPWALFEKKVGFYDKAKFKVGGTRIPVLPLDDEIVMTAVNRAIDDPNPFRKGIIREFASAQGVGSGQISSYEDFNYSSARAELLDVWRGVMRDRSMFVRHTASPIYGCIIEEAIGEGRIVLPAGAEPFQENRTAWTACAWTGPSMGWIDPLKEANAYKILVDMRVTSRTRVAAERGDDISEILAEFAAEQEAADLLDVVLEPAVPGAVQAEPTETSASGVPLTRKNGQPTNSTGDDTSTEEE
jgi:lambda family phage portal protein